MFSILNTLDLFWGKYNNFGSILEKKCNNFGSILGKNATTLDFEKRMMDYRIIGMNSILRSKNILHRKIN